MARPVKTYILVTLFGLLIIKLVVTGIFFAAKGTTWPWALWQNRTALAVDSPKTDKKKETRNSPATKTASSSSKIPDLNKLQEEIASLEAHLKAINADIDKYFNAGAPASRISPETLEQKRRELEREKREIKEERQRLEALKNEIAKQLAELTKIQTTVQGKLDEKKAIRDDRLKHLIKIYTTMPPKKAAMLIDKLEMEVIIALFSKMKGDSVGQILPHVSPEKAAQISERLAKIRQ
jgi:flagellar motility protein MotE (MotC chaperone)